ncbi:MAG: helix-turn-helix domain-containing protein [Eubacterium sp.]|nr:helix-turn-helix domain-containing protein [Eubacterium sp.]
MADANVIGNRLRELREQNAETVRQTAEAVNISESALRMYETGKRIARDEIKERLANHYKSSIASIFFNQ